MELFINVNQKQSQKQKLVLTAQMRESLEILQMTLPELKEHIDKEVLENPLLEYDSNEHNTPDSDLNEAANSFNVVKSFYEYNKKNYRTKVSESYGYNDGDYDPFYTATKKMTFFDYLLNQLLEMEISPAISKICRYIIGNINEKGYLSCSAQKIACDLKIDLKYVNYSIKVVQQMDPAGVCASNLRECLNLQLQRQKESCPFMFDIVNKHLELLSDNKIGAIAQELHISTEKAQLYCNRIRKLNPIPSSGFNTATAEIFIVPEAQILKDSHGNLKVLSNNNFIPKLHFNKFYLKLAETPDNKDTEEYLKNKIRNASSLIQKICRRKKTIIRIIEKIVELQPIYFEKGINYLEPMTMKDIAKELDLNESTVCRAVQNKYILCCEGIISVKSLFTCGLNNKYGNINCSSANVKEKIRKIIKEENKLKPLSDQSIASFLSEREGIMISRRTVAKYRQVLGIPPTTKRKTYTDAV